MTPADMQHLTAHVARFVDGLTPDERIPLDSAGPTIPMIVAHHRRTGETLARTRLLVRAYCALRDLHNLPLDG